VGYCVCTLHRCGAHIRDFAAIMRSRTKGPVFLSCVLPGFLIALYFTQEADAAVLGTGAPVGKDVRTGFFDGDGTKDCCSLA
jgi:hypothetical protein